MVDVLLYYKYIPIPRPEECRKEQLALCQKLGLKGRILIADEGLNGTIAGLRGNIEEYKSYLRNNPLFSDIEFKESTSPDQPFKKLKIKVRKEIVSLNLKKDISWEHKPGYISPEELKALFGSNEEYYIVDMRNKYETELGMFKNSVTLDLEHFRDLPNAVKKIEHLKKKKVIPVCTGGVRCEKASTYLVEQGFENVTQLHGGIINYGKHFPEGDFTGKCYVFDERIALELNDPEHASIISACVHCHNLSGRYINCCNATCNIQFICCETCHEKMGGGCSEYCKEHSRYSRIQMEHSG